MLKLKVLIVFFGLILFTQSTLAGSAIFQMGYFSASEGIAQNVHVQSGGMDRFTINNRYGQNIILGAGYFFEGPPLNCYRFFYGLNAFYTAPTLVQGTVIQAGVTNLSYKYSVKNYPIYFMAKTLVHSDAQNAAVAIDLGVGPNFIQAGKFSENSLIAGATPNDNAFQDKTTVAASATASIGVRFNGCCNGPTIELAYRFFYLGQGSLTNTDARYAEKLTLGKNFANAVILSIAY